MHGGRSKEKGRANPLIRVNDIIEIFTMSDFGKCIEIVGSFFTRKALIVFDNFLFEEWRDTAREFVFFTKYLLRKGNTLRAISKNEIEKDADGLSERGVKIGKNYIQTLRNRQTRKISLDIHVKWRGSGCYLDYTITKIRIAKQLDLFTRTNIIWRKNEKPSEVSKRIKSNKQSKEKGIDTQEV